jgi:hypothetical protein
MLRPRVATIRKQGVGVNKRTVVLAALIAVLSSGYVDARGSRVGGYTRRSTGAYVMPH